MKLKKGFTLAEILIVLMVIGVIATMTIPSIMKGVVDGQIKSSYKKALSAVISITAAEKTAGFLPSTNKSSETANMFQTLNSNLSVVGYAARNASEINSGNTINPKNYVKGLKINGKLLGSGENPIEITNTSITTYGPSPWIISEDNIAYSIMCGGKTGVAAPCSTKQQIAAQPTQKQAIEKSCTVIIVDVNGLSKGPNTFDPQISDTRGFHLNTVTKALNPNEPLDTLTGDQYLIFVGSDGATAGPRENTVTGRIAADLK